MFIRTLAAACVLLTHLGLPALAQPSGVTRTGPSVTATARVQPANEHGACQLGLISIVGDKFEIAVSGALPFQSGDAYDPVDWNLNDLVFARLRAAAPGLNVRNIIYTREALRTAVQSHSLFGGMAADIRDFARKVSAGTPCDRYIVVHRDVFLIDGSRLSSVGFGVTLIHSLGMKDRAYLHALTYIRLYDGRSFELIKEAAAMNGDAPHFADFKNYRFLYRPFQQIDAGSFPTMPRQGGTNPVFRDTIRSLLSTSLDRTLRKMLAPEAKPSAT